MDPLLNAKQIGSQAYPNSTFLNQIVTKETSKKYCFEKIPLSVGINQSSEFTRDIEIPPIPPSFDHCDIIKLRYHVFVKVNTSAIFSRGATASVPLVIGTVPIRQIHTSEPNYIGLEAYMQPPAPTVPPPDYDFTEANFHEGDPDEKSEIKEEDGEEDFPFQPRFAFYSDKTKLINPRH
uniref:Arrestin C-terminal-like domain-containing protein n=1 Tax=Panagrolaimus sp. PS1159 TaxID=55785 RepID=A0AC35EVM6_9BILA